MVSSHCSVNRSLRYIPCVPPFFSIILLLLLPPRASRIINHPFFSAQKMPLFCGRTYRRNKSLLSHYFEHALEVLYYTLIYFCTDFALDRTCMRFMVLFVTAMLKMSKKEWENKNFCLAASKNVRRKKP